MLSRFATVRQSGILFVYGQHCQRPISQHIDHNAKICRSLSSNNNKNKAVTDDNTKCNIAVLPSSLSHENNDDNTNNKSVTTDIFSAPFKKKKGERKKTTLIRFQDVSRSIYSHYYYKDPHHNAITYRNKLPTLDSSPLFDPVKYCRRFNGSISGSAAALRLREGREIAMQHLRHDLCTRRKKARAFVLEGHGVPPQLLSDHIDFGRKLLHKHYGATECSFNNFDGKLIVDWVRVRRNDGKNFASPWPPQQSGDSDSERLELYLTVMNRLSTTFGSVLDPNGDEEALPHHWTVRILRGSVYPTYILPNSNNIHPIVELTLREGITAPRNVRISLQQGAISLVYEACFSKTLIRR